ncbi:hypothetical protein [Streptomyces mayteni]
MSFPELDSFIDLPEELEDDLIAIGNTLPAWSVEGTFLAHSTIERYRTELDTAPLFGDIKDRLLPLLGEAAGGYAVVRLRNVARALGIGDRFLRLATASLAEGQVGGGQTRGTSTRAPRGTGGGWVGRLTRSEPPPSTPVG